MKEQIILFPGFSQSKTLYGNYSYLNIWEEKYIKYDLSNAKYLIGHSMGSLACLMNWKENPNTTVILFNPLIPKRNNLNILFRFTKMILTSSGTIRAIKGRTDIKYIPIAIRNALIFLKVDAIEIIKQIPKDKLIIIRGENDNYFCDLESALVLKNFDITSFELKNVGHYWTSEVDNYIAQFIK
ncbi:MAG TPA: hypothetical protein VIK86_02795 [Candidatus Paceibacterota bacterium]